MGTLNIGLAVNDGSTISPAHALAAVKAIGGVKALLARVYCSDTEPTLVIETRGNIYATAAYELAKFLKQDAIASWDGYDGQLVGPNAAAWGGFDRSAFINIDGNRLAA